MVDVETGMARGWFISLEGPEAVGKSTQLPLLAEALRSRGHEVVVTREPGGTPLGEELRALIKHFGMPESVCPEAELLMLGASRAQLVRDVVRPHLEAGHVVISDRFADSTTVYQGAARGLDMQFVTALHEFCVGGCWPDLTLLIDLDVASSASRCRARTGEAEAGKGADRFESEGGVFHATVRQGFLDLAAAHRERIVAVNGAGSPEAVHRAIMEVVDRVVI